VIWYLNSYCFQQINVQLGLITLTEERALFNGGRIGALEGNDFFLNLILRYFSYFHYVLEQNRVNSFFRILTHNFKENHADLMLELFGQMLEIVVDLIIYIVHQIQRYIITVRHQLQIVLIYNDLIFDFSY